MKKYFLLFCLAGAALLSGAEDIFNGGFDYFACDWP